MSEENKNQVEEPKITLEDIQMIQRIISIASSRGAFRAEEMSPVGRVYDRVSNFLSHNAPEQKEAEEGEQSEDKKDGDSKEG